MLPLAIIALLTYSAFAPPFLFFLTNDEGCVQSPISWWKLNETTGARTDSRGGNTLEVTPGLVDIASQAGVISNAANFVAADAERLSCASTANLTMTNTSWSFAFWLKVQTANIDYNLLNKVQQPGDSEYDVTLYGGTNSVAFTVWTSDISSNIIVSTNTVQTNVWTFVAGVYNMPAQTISISVNNSPFHSIGSVTNSYGAVSVFSLGSADSGAPSYLDGAMDETAVWKCALTQEDVNFLYNGGLGRTYNPATAHVE
ncbi:MAG: LamG domain-containing protein [Candidatus Saccharibacteria bacterium]|nr:LamG domain-containing protein [Candidatus Saccharibacteria bacterium]